MSRYIVTAAAAMILVGIISAELQAQPARIGRGIRFRQNIVDGYSDRGYTTLFDLYRIGKIPLPPYYSLHPPVYYGNRTFQSYGSTPFAFPYNWWQQYGFGSPYGAAAPLGRYADRPVLPVVRNPYFISPRAEIDEQPAEAVAPPAEDTAASTRRMIINPYVRQDPPSETILAAQ